MSQQDILQYIPQRPPFVMIDSIAKADGIVSETNFTIREGHLFVEDGTFTEPGLVENMAQTAAAGTGYSLMQQGKTVPVGFIGALKGLNIMDFPKVGDTITTEVSFKNQVLNVHIVQGRVFNKGQEIANCELKIFLQES
ncbi:3-hydroxyacyl-ACP dehydratase [Chitinophagaceae bacterium IBVUCB1]|nr:3-hydroxyacyl-ACP dehydratase [Chitinophagaceae bacterium IBVUCB1]